MSCPLCIEYDRFHQRLAYALRHPAVNLPLAEEVVDDFADIVDRRITRQRNHASFRIDFNLAEVTPIGEV